MKIIGITGGIGSGKTTVAKMFESFGIPVYYADDEAKALMNRSKTIKKKLVALLGDSAYENEKINRKYIASKVFNHQDLLKKINAIVHPKVKVHFEKWLKKQDSSYVLKESAIIFENNLQSHYDAIILVVADKHKRIDRVMKRDHLTKEQVQAIIKNQYSDQKKIPLSTYLITNDIRSQSQFQVEKLHNQLLKRYK